METTLYYLPDCPSYGKALENLKEALRLERLSEEVEMIAVADGNEARAARFLGSPTIRINGVDVEGPEAESAGYGYGCRVYAGGARTTGWPSVRQIQKALQWAR